MYTDAGHASRYVIKDHMFRLDGGRLSHHHDDGHDLASKVRAKGQGIEPVVILSKIDLREHREDECSGFILWSAFE